MKVLKSKLTLVIDCWSDPGDYPNGLASGPLPSRDFVEDVAGLLTFELEAADIGNLEGDTSIAAVQSYLDGNANLIDHGEPGLTVKSWDMHDVQGSVVTVAVKEFEAEVPEPDYD